MKEGLNLLIDNIQNTKNKLYNNLVNKGVKTITTSSTLSEMADSVNLITTGESTTTTITKIVNTNWLVSPEELIYDYENQYSEKHNWSWDNDFNNNQRRQLIYPTGDYVFNNDWEVVYRNSDEGYLNAKHTNGDNYTTRSTYVTDEFFRMKSDSRYELITDCWNEWTQEQNYYKATEIPFNNIEEIYIKPENKDNIYIVTAATQCEFKFYEYNPYAYSYEEHQFIHPSNGSEYTFYPIIEKKPYYLKLVYDGSNSYEVVGAIIEFTDWLQKDGDILTLPSHRKSLKADYLLFYDGGWFNKFNFQFDAASNGYDYQFDYHSKNITRLETVTFNDRCVHIWYGFKGSYIDYIGELIFNNNIKETYYDWMGDIEYCLMKNIGACPNASLFRFTSYYWGIGEKYSNSRQSLVDSLITYSYDRASAGYSTVNIQLNQNTKARLTESEIAQITAKGYTIA